MQEPPISKCAARKHITSRRSALSRRVTCLAIGVVLYLEAERVPPKHARVSRLAARRICTRILSPHPASLLAGRGAIAPALRPPHHGALASRSRAAARGVPTDVHFPAGIQIQDTASMLEVQPPRYSRVCAPRGYGREESRARGGYIILSLAGGPSKLGAFEMRDADALGARARQTDHQPDRRGERFEGTDARELPRVDGHSVAHARAGR
ncbi:hypothetical protein V8D89_008564 [Ganoderma adspersum]